MQDGGKYTDSVDIYALGVIITEIYAACNSTLEDATGIFLSYLMESENYPLHPVQFQLQFPHLLTPQVRQGILVNYCPIVEDAILKGKRDKFRRRFWIFCGFGESGDSY